MSHDEIEKRFQQDLVQGNTHDAANLLRHELMTNPREAQQLIRDSVAMDQQGQTVIGQDGRYHIAPLTAAHVVQDQRTGQLSVQNKYTGEMASANPQQELVMPPLAYGDQGRQPFQGQAAYEAQAQYPGQPQYEGQPQYAGGPPGGQPYEGQMQQPMQQPMNYEGQMAPRQGPSEGAAIAESALGLAAGIGLAALLSRGQRVNVYHGYPQHYPREMVWHREHDRRHW